MRRFHLVRTADVTGVSGTGVVAHGCQFDDGTVVIRWLGRRPSTVAWSSIEGAIHVHGHAASTQIRWIDDEDAAVAELDPASVWIVPRTEDTLADTVVTSDGNAWVWACLPYKGPMMTPAEARIFGAQYLAAADKADRQAATHGA